MVGMMFSIIFFILCFMALFLNRDVFSPSKFYLVYLAVYFSDIFINEYSMHTNIVYLTYLIIGIFFVVIDAKYWKNRKIKKSFEDCVENESIDESFNWKKINKFIWILTIIPIIAQLILISDMGGLQGYINSINLRVYLWRGKGILIEFIKMYGILNLIYFSVMLSKKKWKKSDWFLFIFHFTGYILIGLLSGSRSSLLFNIGIMVILYNYQTKRVKLKSAIATLAIILLVASVLGIARNGIYWDDGGFRTAFGLKNNYFELSNFKYGLEPLELVFTSNNNNIKYGLTFITPFTNIIPRSIWPGKPDTGGVVITKEYMGNPWGGYSNISTGIIAEGVINFGKVMGSFFGFSLLVSLCIVLVVFYNKILKRNYHNKFKSNIYLIIYTYILVAIPSLIYTEWTNTILGLALKVAKVILFFLILNYLSNRRRQVNNSNAVISRL